MMVRVFANGPGDLSSIPSRSYQKLKKCFLIPPCLRLRIIKYGSRVKWSNSGKEVAPSLIPWCSSYRKGTCRSPSTTVANFTYCIYIYIYIYGMTLYTETHACAHTCENIEIQTHIRILTHTHTHIYIYIYIYIERERENIVSNYLSCIVQFSRSFS